MIAGLYTDGIAGPSSWIGWLGSLVLHAGILSVIFTMSYSPLIQVNDRSYVELVLTERAVPIPQTIMAGTGGDPARAGRLDKPNPTPTAPPSEAVRAIHQRDTVVHKPVQTRTVQREAKQVMRDVMQVEQADSQVEHPEHRDAIIPSEPQAAVTQELQMKPLAPMTVPTARMFNAENRQTNNVREKEPQETVGAEHRSIVLPEMNIHASAVVTTNEAVSLGLNSSDSPRAVLKEHTVVQVVPDVGASSAIKPATGTVMEQSPSEPAGNTAADVHAQRGQEISAAPSAVTSLEQTAPITTSTQESSHSATSSPYTSGAGNGTGPDYGWLKRLLWERINRVKHYSPDAIEHEWEGRVVIIATIRRDGRIVGVNVIESSGNRHLDGEAERLVANASPLPLNRALGAERVKIRVPISFGLE